MTDHGHGQGQGRGGDPVAMMERAAEAAGSVIDRVTPEQMSLQTPCTDWTVRDAINHLIVGNAWTVESLETGSAPRPSGDMTGDDPEAAYAESERRMLAAFRDPANLQRTVEMPFGTMPGAALAGMSMVELLVHAWDIAKATGQSTDIAPDLSEAALGVMRARMGDQDRANTPFDPPTTPPPDATAADRLAAFLGRTV